MSFMIAFCLMCIMLLIGVILRAKIKLFYKILMPASVLGGIVGFFVLNAGILKNVEFGLYNQMTAEFFTLSFIALGLTGISNDSKDKESSVAKNLLQGSVGIAAIWSLLWAVTPLIGYLVVKLMSGFTDMNAVYGLLIPTAFCDGPGLALTFGNMFESYGWDNASQVGVMFAVIGFFYAFGIGVPLAKYGMKKGLTKYSSEKIDDSVAKGLYPKEKQNESIGTVTTYSGSIDTLALHIALIGFTYIIAVGISKLILLIPYSIAETLSSLMFMWGLIAAYLVRWGMKKLKVQHYLNDSLMTRMTGAFTDLLICSAFMSIQISLIISWIVPILIVTAVAGFVTYLVCIYFGQRMGSTYDFERTLGLFGCATGTVPTGLALIRIVDPNFKTLAATELGAMNLVAMALSTVLYVAIPSMAQLLANGGSINSGLIVCLITALVCLVIMKVFRVWGKPTFKIKEDK